MDRTVDAVINACSDPNAEVEHTKSLIREMYGNGVRFFEYDKCGRTQGRITLPNVGREFHTYALHVATHYYDLADVVVFTPAVTRGKRPKRAMLLADRTKHAGRRFECIEGSGDGYGDHDEVKYWKHGARYEGRPLDLAEPRGLRRWALQHVGAYYTGKVCTHGTFVTTRELLRNTPRSQYEHLRDLLSTREPEAGHYCERLAREIFGNDKRVPASLLAQQLPERSGVSLTRMRR